MILKEDFLRKKSTQDLATMNILEWVMMYYS